MISFVFNPLPIEKSLIRIKGDSDLMDTVDNWLYFPSKILKDANKSKVTNFVGILKGKAKVVAITVNNLF
jgi:hypothetical protein